MSDALVAELQRRCTELDGQLKDARADAAKRRTANKKLTAENADLTGKLTKAAGRVTELEAQAGKAPTEAQARIDELTSEVRGHKHKAVFRDKATEAGVDPKAIDTLWRESGYKADADDVSEDAISEAITRSKESHPFLFKPPADAGGPATANPFNPAPAPARPLGSDRGGQAGPSTFKVRESQLADPAWKQANQAAFNKASQDGNLQIIPG